MFTATAKRILGIFTFAIVAANVRGDDVRPVQVQLREQEPGLFLVQWVVPKLIPLQATPLPVLPEGCEPEGERTVQDQEATWIHRETFRCDAALAGQTLAVDYPFLNTSVSTVIRLSLLSGEEHARILAPGEKRWELPEAPPEMLQVLRGGVVTGVAHVLDEWVHVALVVVLALAGAAALTGWFALGQLAAVVLSLAGVSMAPNLSEIGVAVAVVLLARETLRGAQERRAGAGVAAACGVVHGLGLGSRVGDPGVLVLSILGIDATLLVLGTLVSLLLRGEAWRRGFSYASGIAAVALALGLFFSPPPTRASAARENRLPNLAGGSGGGGSRRIAPPAPDAAVQSFVAIEAFETRHEILVRLARLWRGDEDVIAVDQQAAVTDRIAETILTSASIAIDGTPREALVDRVDFVTSDARGVLPRPEPVPEAVEDAFIGVTIVYLTAETPHSMTLTWSDFDVAASVPATIIDPESTRTAVLSPDKPEIAWTNELSEDPIPTVSAVDVEPRSLALPLASIPLLALAVWCLVKRHTGLARIALAGALVVAPVGTVAVALAVSPVPSAGDARRILASLLPNVYRAFEFREESAAYDRLAVSVTGETLTDVYLEHRRALEMEERGGARARVEAVEVRAVDRVAPGADGGFDAVARWTVGGTVTHFGHRHFRENRYRASVTVVPVDDRWKIRAIEVLEEERVR